ncbi:MAG: hypothetical protein LBO80_12170 [Treponema sp.]|jgi:S-formylglutathione hydrolase FrmB|nr:hypothetical protein [Treponema sp.]
MRPGGKDGFLYRVVFGTAITGDGTVTLDAGFYKIVSRAASGSGFPAPSADMIASGYKALGPGNIYYAEAGQELETGDAVIPLTLKRISFVTDVQDSGQKQSHDVTTQADVDSGSRAYISGAFQERTGTISGVVDVDSEEQRELFNEYREIVYQLGGNTGVAPAKSLEHEYMMSRREAAESGETEMWEYMPLISESIQAPKPMDGVQSFSFNYRIDGKRKPCMIVREVA